MAPNMTKRPVGAPSALFNEDDSEPSVVDEGNQIAEGETVENNKYKPYRYQRQIVWRNVALFAYLHVAALYGAYLMFASAKITTSIWGELFIFSMYLFIILFNLLVYFSNFTISNVWVGNYCWST